MQKAYQIGLKFVIQDQARRKKMKSNLRTKDENYLKLTRHKMNTLDS